MDEQTLNVVGFGETKPEPLKRFEDGPLEGRFVPAELKVELDAIGYVAISKDVLELIKSQLRVVKGRSDEAIGYIDAAIERTSRNA